MKDGGPAFPVSVDRPLIAYEYAGMSLRDFFAAAALQGYLACDDQRICEEDGSAIVGHKTSEVFARLAYEQADAMLTQRDKS